MADKIFTEEDALEELNRLKEAVKKAFSDCRARLGLKVWKAKWKRGEE